MSVQAPQRPSAGNRSRPRNTNLPGGPAALQDGIDTLVLLALLGLSVAGFGPTFGSGAHYLIAGYGGILLGLAIAWLGARARLGVLVLAVLTLVAYLLFGSALAAPTQAAFGILPTFESLTTVLLGIVVSWKQLLTVAAPVGIASGLLVVPFLASLVAAVTAGSLCWRLRRTVFTVLPVLGLFILSIAFGTDDAVSPLLRKGMIGSGGSTRMANSGSISLCLDPDQRSDSKQRGSDPPVPANPSLVPASAGKRLGAKLIDAVPLVVLAVAFWQVSGASDPVADGSAAAAAERPTEMLLLIGAGFLAYWLWLWGWEATGGKTPGNVILGIRTSNLDGFRAGWVAIFLRGLIISAGLPALVVGAVIVVISSLWDRNGQRQGWHDKVALTYGFDVRAGRNPLVSGGLAGPDSRPAGQATQPTRQAPQPTGQATQPTGVTTSAGTAAPAPIDRVPGGEKYGGVHPDDEFEATRISPRRRGNGVRIKFDDGRDISLGTEALIGRDPAARMGETIDQLISCPDQGRSVSKTHLHLRVEGTTLWGTNRNSTNGSAVMSAEGDRSRLAAETPLRADPGSKVHFGDRNFVVEDL